MLSPFELAKMAILLPITRGIMIRPFIEIIAVPALHSSRERGCLKKKMNASKPSESTQDVARLYLVCVKGNIIIGTGYAWMLFSGGYTIISSFDRRTKWQLVLCFRDLAVLCGFTTPEGFRLRFHGR